MKKIILPAILVNVISFTTYSQTNLVLNPSFEQYTLCPGSGEVITNGHLTYCSNPNNLTPDYFNACDWTETLGVPSNVIGYQNAKDGYGYVGIQTWQINLSGGEYIQMKLTSPLLGGHGYSFRCYLSNAELANYGSSNIGVYFSNDSIYNPVWLLPYTPQIHNSAEHFFADTINWMPFTGFYNATGGEQFLIIGNFDDGITNADTVRIGHRTPGINNARDGTYFYIDDVSLTDSTVGIQEVGKDKFSVYPNPTNQTLHLQSNQKLKTLSIKDITGREVIYISSPENIIDVSELSKGIYFIEGYIGDNKVTVKFVKE